MASRTSHDQPWPKCSAAHPADRLGVRGRRAAHGDALCREPCLRVRRCPAARTGRPSCSTPCAPARSRARAPGTPPGCSARRCPATRSTGRCRRCAPRARRAGAAPAPRRPPAPVPRPAAARPGGPRRGRGGRPPAPGRAPRRTRTPMTEPEPSRATSRTVRRPGGGVSSRRTIASVSPASSGRSSATAVSDRTPVRWWSVQGVTSTAPNLPPRVDKDRVRAVRGLPRGAPSGAPAPRLRRSTRFAGIPRGWRVSRCRKLRCRRAQAARFPGNRGDRGRRMPRLPGSRVDQGPGQRDFQEVARRTGPATPRDSESRGR